jgi:hypothetical protein
VTTNRPVPAAEGLVKRPRTGGDQQRCAGPVRGGPEGPGETAAERQPRHRHARLEQAEDNADPDPGPGTGTGDADTDRGGEVRKAEG